MLYKYHLKALDGIRGIACLLVIMAHYMIQAGVKGSYGQQTGALGVIIFFVLSGFLMMHVTKNLEFTVKNIEIFFVKRFSRVIPLFYISLLILYIYQKICTALGVNDSFLAFNNLSSIKEVLLNVVFVKGDVVFWSIGPEIVFYLMFPIIWYFKKYGNMKFLMICLFVFLFFRSTNFYTDWNFNFTRIGFTFQYFLFGSFSYIFFDENRNEREDRKNLIFLVSLLLVLSFSPYLGGKITGYDCVPIEYKDLYTKQPYLYFIVPFLIVSSANSKISNIIFGNAVFSFFGKMSFSMYIWHYVVIRMFSGFIGNPTINIPLFFIFVLMPIVSFVSYISYKFLETPLSKYASCIFTKLVSKNT
ncbi:MAG: acyltransferase [Acetobacter sp.]|jgi:peptidoglycan/LPS O-acetylase OafA/YrhL|nr:acyltransferase [Acetobacter sp.]MCH4060169.1 acyltransferase [Acetobacter sp.]MCH4087109.1 acyltransferase [Acetobacter sp.]MCI1292929.1 acyltransferase [Acetobacter sp.]MCI1319515.1 acyltransferase [Acetobacter sp.]